MSKVIIKTKSTKNRDTIIKLITKDLKFNYDYRTAYFILLEYWDSFHDEDKKEIDKRLKKLGL